MPRVRLYLRGVPLMLAAVDRIDADGLDVCLPNRHLPLGTYVEIALPGTGVEGVGTMVAQHSSHGIGLNFVSWGPHLFDLIELLADFRAAGLADARRCHWRSHRGFIVAAGDGEY